jgi:hypothetical protein
MATTARCRVKNPAVSLEPQIVSQTPQIVSARLSRTQIRTALEELQAMGFIERFADEHGTERFRMKVKP